LAQPLFSLSALSPTSPLFPYTTLFRSLVDCLGLRDHFGVDEPRHSSPKFLLLRRQGDHARLRSRQVASSSIVRSTPVPISRLMRDRKSTRLNSSHEWISYAVFCLKKKS